MRIKSWLEEASEDVTALMNFQASGKSGVPIFVSAFIEKGTKNK